MTTAEPRILVVDDRAEARALIASDLAEAGFRVTEAEDGNAGWHSFRRAWATARKHMPLQDVMAAGGWRDPAALQEAYQHADAETIRAVLEAT